LLSHNHSYLLLVAALPLALSGCLNDKSGALSAARATAQVGTAASSLVVQGGVRSVKVIFKVGSNGSFDSPSAAGTTQGTGVAAARYFNSEGIAIAKPDWLTSRS